MHRLSAITLVLLLFLRGIGTAQENTAEQRAYDAAQSAFRNGDYERAETWFAEFVADYPSSELRARAVLMQAEARYHQKNYDGAFDLLRDEFIQARSLGDHYRYRQAESLMMSGKNREAAELFAQMLREFPNSTLRLNASFNVARAYFELGQWDEVIATLRDPDRVFAQIAREQPNSENVLRGRLLLAEVLWRKGDLAACEALLQELAQLPLRSPLEWQRQYLSCRVLLSQQKLAEALEATTKLLEVAAESGQREYQAESVLLQARILEDIGRETEAVAIYEKNLGEGVPELQRRTSLLKIIELTLERNRVAEGIELLQRLVNQPGRDSAKSLARLTLGELFLKQYHTATDPARPSVAVEPGNDLLQRALAQLDSLIEESPESPLTGRAHLIRGWCFWEQGSFPESSAAFSNAVERLSHSEYQAVARFKLADTLYRMEDFEGAVRNYRQLIEEYEDLSPVRNTLFDQALHQTARAALEIGDLRVAAEAVNRILDWYPNSFFADRSQLLLGQALNRREDPAGARALFSAIINRRPDSPFVPEVRLAVARTFELEGDWETAVEQYDAWVGEYTLHPSLPSAEFFRALAHYRAGEETRALTLFTNFVGRFPDHELARRAQDWVGDYYFRENKFDLAERHYQELVLKWPESPLAPRARLKAGQAAYRRLGFSDAREHFTWLINNGPPAVPDSTIPRAVVAEAYFALGDLILEELLPGATTPEEAAARNRERFREARNTFKRIVDNLPDDPLVPLAWGKIGDCNYQLAEREPALYEEAAEAYRKVIDSPVSNLAARSQAEIGLGHVRRDQARAPSVPDTDRGNLLAQAADHYANVFHGRNVRPGESERPIPRWQKTAGLALAELALARSEWEESVRIYQHLARTYPVLEPSMEKRIADVRKSQETQKN